MSLKNDPLISEFGKRLFQLIEEADTKINLDEEKIKSPKGLAKKFYDLGLVHVNTNEKDNFNSPEVDYNNAVASIEKTIVRHIKTGILKDQKGEFIIAYSKFFACSTDYILGLTDIQSPDAEVRRICELTGLSEVAVNRLIESKKRNQIAETEGWSLLMSSQLYYTIPADWVALAEEARIGMQKEGEFNALQWEESQVEGPDKMDIQLDMQGLKLEIDSRRAAFYGLLSKLSRNIENLIEQNVLTKLQPYRQMLAEEWLKDTMRKYNK